MTFLLFRCNEYYRLLTLEVHVYDDLLTSARHPRASDVPSIVLKSVNCWMLRWSTLAI